VKHKYTVDEEAQIAEAYSDCTATIRELIAVFGGSYHSVYRTLAKRGVQIRGRGSYSRHNRRGRFPEQDTYDRKKLALAYARMKRKSFREVAARFGCDAETVRLAYREYAGLPSWRYPLPAKDA
jgi:transposase